MELEEENEECKGVRNIYMEGKGEICKEGRIGIMKINEQQGG